MSVAPRQPWHDRSASGEASPWTPELVDVKWAHEVESLRFDRRRAHREAVEGTAVAAFRTRSRTSLLAGVTVRDVSATGLGMVSPVAVAVGTRVSLFPHESRVPSAIGVVVRCERAGSEFRLGIERPSAQAAA
ncbi:MAG: PilZ domain-containing protein [Phycisphaerales bacterium]|nr:MAG: PilZ domain-containing protein [Phycisphaerales bacterium]